MSKYRDFYVQSGEGAFPINSYRPLSLGTAASNPANWDPATGIWTDPDSNVWLETGNTLPAANNSGSYPDATIITTGGSSGLIATFANPRGAVNGASPAYDNVRDVWWLTNGSNLQLQEATYDSGTNTMTLTGNNITVTGTGMTACYFAAVDTTNDWLLLGLAATGTRRLSAINRTTGAEIFGFNVANGSTNNLTYGTWDNARRKIFWAQLSNRIVQVFDVSTTAFTVDTSYNISGTTTNIVGMGYDPGNDQYIVKSSTNIQLYDNTFTFQSTPFTGTPADGRGAVFYDPDSTIFMQQGFGSANMQEYGIGITSTVIGDPTARTSTDTGQPLFIRLK